jgi:tRNA U34 5-methylaminomethyl-2-thiouridine-forming methyltransferase MnmC
MSDPLIPATVAFRPNGSPYSPLYGDIYHSVVGSLAQARYVFLQGNGLPGRWQERAEFIVLETGFGMGINFLTTWAAWRADPARGERLHFVSIEKHPFSAGDLRLTHAATVDDESVAALAERLAAAWPVLTPGTHTLAFDNGSVTLTLIFGDAVDVLPTLELRADAIYLDGFAPAKNPGIWTPSIFASLAKLAADNATFSTYTSAGDVKRALLQAGFEYKKVPGFGWKRAMLVGRFPPRFEPRQPSPKAI